MGCVSSTLLALLAASEWIQYPELMMFVHLAEITSRWFDRVLVFPSNRLPKEGLNPRVHWGPHCGGKRGQRVRWLIPLWVSGPAAHDGRLMFPRKSRILHIRPVSPPIMIINNKNQVEKWTIVLPSQSVVSAMCKRCLKSRRQTLVPSFFIRNLEERNFTNL